ncbi:septum formation family protein [Micromonospora sp. C31]|uniref:septum formation family protein n=1 Tax=Micromonospora sp. C31 TaxID=2824876 RepID=UPI001B383326|nr:septum formation family protein [Micromonospora sp. C31]MBQ1076723.1 septum formation family protein [Micromonospora sp. C31]
MPRWTASLVVPVMLAALTGCVESSAGDRGRSTFAPQAGACHRFDVQEGDRDSYAPVACTEVHEAESVHVGAFVSDDAEQDAAPARHGPALRKAFDACDTAATNYVGGEWRGARLLLRVVIPTEQGWTAGERWFRCDLSEITYLEVTDPRPRQGSLKDVLEGTSDLAFDCLNVTELPDGDPGGLIELDSCAVTHDAEYTGVWRAPEIAFANVAAEDGPTGDGCWDVVARYVSVSRDDLVGRADVLWRLPSEQNWLAGDRGIRCFLWIPDRTLTRSLRNSGTKGLPAPGRPG